MTPSDVRLVGRFCPAAARRLQTDGFGKPDNCFQKNITRCRGDIAASLLARACDSTFSAVNDSICVVQDYAAVISLALFAFMYDISRFVIVEEKTWLLSRAALIITTIRAKIGELKKVNMLTVIFLRFKACATHISEHT